MDKKVGVFPVSDTVGWLVKNVDSWLTLILSVFQTLYYGHFEPDNSLLIKILGEQAGSWIVSTEREQYPKCGTTTCGATTGRDTDVTCLAGISEETERSPLP